MSLIGVAEIVKQSSVSHVITTQTPNAYVRGLFSLDLAIIAAGIDPTGTALFVWRDFASSAKPEESDAIANQCYSIRTAIPKILLRV